MEFFDMIFSLVLSFGYLLVSGALSIYLFNSSKGDEDLFLVLAIKFTEWIFIGYIFYTNVLN